MFIIGLTGGIGSGKSTIAAFFKPFVNVIDADEVARCVVKPDSPTLGAIVTHFGKEVINSDGSLNRAWLRHKIFSDLNAKSWLENLLHPIIRAKIISMLQEARSPYCILMSPLLLETDQYLLTNRILVIDTPEDKQIERITKRDNASADAVKAIMRTQLARQVRLQKADDIIINTGDVSILNKYILHLHDIYLELATRS